MEEKSVFTSDLERRIIGFNVPNCVKYLQSQTIEEREKREQRAKELQNKFDNKAYNEFSTLCEAIKNNTSYIKPTESYTNEEKAEKIEIEKIESELFLYKEVSKIGVLDFCDTDIEIINTLIDNSFGVDLEDLQTQLDKQIQADEYVYKKAYQGKIKTFDIGRFEYIENVNYVLIYDKMEVFKIAETLGNVKFIQYLNDKIKELEVTEALTPTQKRRKKPMPYKIELLKRTGILNFIQQELRFDNYHQQAQLLEILLNEDVTNIRKELKKPRNKDKDFIYLDEINNFIDSITERKEYERKPKA